MSGTVHDQAFDREAWRMMETAEGSQAIALMRRLVREGWGAESGIRDALGQPYGGWTPGQLLALMHLGEWAVDGRIARVKVEVGRTPMRDSARTENAAALLDIAWPFNAEVDTEQHCGDFDGSLSWTEPITLSVDWGGEETVTVPPRSKVALEVGTCAPSRVWMHLRETGVVARWPYESDQIWLFLGLPNPHDFVLGLGKPRARALTNA